MLRVAPLRVPNEGHDSISNNSTEKQIEKGNKNVDLKTLIIVHSDRWLDKKDPRLNEE